MIESRTCAMCGSQADAAARFCPTCGARLDSEPSGGADRGRATAADALDPATSGRVPRTNGFAVASLVLGLVTGGVGSLLAVIFGHHARRQIRESDGEQSGGGMALAGVTLGWLGLIAAVILVAIVIEGHHNRASSLQVRENCAVAAADVESSLWDYQHGGGGPSGIGRSDPAPPTLEALYASAAGNSVTESERRLIAKYGGDSLYNGESGVLTLQC